MVRDDVWLCINIISLLLGLIKKHVAWNYKISLQKKQKNLHIFALLRVRLLNSLLLAGNITTEPVGDNAMKEKWKALPGEFKMSFLQKYGVLEVTKNNCN